MLIKPFISSPLNEANVTQVSEEFLTAYADDLETGEISILELDIRLKFAEKVIENARAKLYQQAKDSINNGKTVLGVEAKVRAGSVQLDLAKDVEYKKYDTLLKERAELLKQAHKSSQPVYSLEGEEIPKPHVKGYTKDALIYTFPKE